MCCILLFYLLINMLDSDWCIVGSMMTVMTLEGTHKMSNINAVKYCFEGFKKSKVNIFNII